ncbi:hypothetical protein PR048_008016 [Dryococelus australis]|uniref:Uncharacterized protein n=1 Tax=Dryococelus australis TaxID=614101 RepID=A0ABQ9HVW9_9NEOP|nr:hypothetical protein PR048_008016 [Dryococelus australis]
MVIEQNLVRSMKVKGGLTSGRDFSDSVLTQWIFYGPGCLKLCDALEKLCGNSNTSSEQHVELRDSRRSRDDRDIQKFLDWFSDHPPFQTSQVLQSISTGVVADENIDCDQATTIGKKAPALKVREDIIPVNPQQLFMRIICVMKNESDFMTYFKYELAPKPPVIFDEISMRKTATSPLAMILKSCDVTSENISADRKVVVDGGDLVHALVWPRRATFDQICEAYVTLVQKHFSLTATVVFDGDDKCSTKGDEWRRRSAGRSSTDLSIAANNVVTSIHSCDVDCEGRQHTLKFSAYPQARLRERFSVYLLISGTLIQPVLSSEREKKQTWNIVKSDVSIRSTANVFMRPKVEKRDIISAGVKFAMSLYQRHDNYATLDELRVHMYTRKTAKLPVSASLQLASLSPTNATCEQHSLQVYLRVQEWLGHSLDPAVWGWKSVSSTLVPITTSLPPAP